MAISPFTVITIALRASLESCLLGGCLSTERQQGVAGGRTQGGDTHRIYWTGQVINCKYTQLYNTYKTKQKSWMWEDVSQGHPQDILDIEQVINSKYTHLYNKYNTSFRNFQCYKHGDQPPTRKLTLAKHTLGNFLWTLPNRTWPQVKYFKKE